MNDRELIDRYYAAMRVGAAAEDEMLRLFTADAVYAEPFSGRPDAAVGIDAIRDRLRAGWAQPLPDMELDMLTLELSADSATCTWECRSPVFPAPVRGQDVYTFRDGRIARLEVTITDPA